MASTELVDPYLDPETGILRNKIGARTQAALDNAEGDLSFARLMQLMDHPPKATGDLDELRAIHGSLNRPGFDGGSDDTEGSLSWDRGSIPMSCGSGSRGRALDALADSARAKGAVRRIAEELGARPEALRSWVEKARVDGGLRPGTTTDGAARIKEPALEVHELRRADEILPQGECVICAPGAV